MKINPDESFLQKSLKIAISAKFQKQHVSRKLVFYSRWGPFRRWFCVKSNSRKFCYFSLLLKYVTRICLYVARIFFPITFMFSYVLACHSYVNVVYSSAFFTMIIRNSVISNTFSKWCF